MDAIERAAQLVRARSPVVPRVALILGSGLGVLGDEVEDAIAIPFTEIPGFAGAAVEGHAGRLVLGRLEGIPCAVLQGRFHLYEGHDPATVVLPTRVMLALGARTAALTAKAMLGYGAVKSAEDHLAVWEYLDRRASLLDRYRTDRLLARTAAHYAKKES